MSKKIENLEKNLIKKDVPKLNIGDTIQVNIKIKEEDKSRIQMFEGVVIRKKGTGVGQNFTVRRISYGEGVERTFPLYSPNIDSIKVVRKGKVRRAKLYYLRKKIGKKTKVGEKELSGSEKSLPDAAPREKSAE